MCYPLQFTVEIGVQNPQIFMLCPGFFFGRTPLIMVSPKKTWEGFIGGFIGTVLLSFVFTRIMTQFDWMICPRLDLSMGRLTCERDAIYQMSEYSIADLGDVLPSSIVDLVQLIAVYIPKHIQDSILRQTFMYEPMVGTCCC